MTPKELLSRRRDLGMSQAELAKELGIPANTIARWERGELTIARPQMLGLAIRCIESDIEELTDEQRHAHNLRVRKMVEREIAAEAANRTPERDAAERWFGKH